MTEARKTMSITPRAMLECLGIHGDRDTVDPMVDGMLTWTVVQGAEGVDPTLTIRFAPAHPDGGYESTEEASWTLTPTGEDSPTEESDETDFSHRYTYWKDDNDTYYRTWDDTLRFHKLLSRPDGTQHWTLVQGTNLSNVHKSGFALTKVMDSDHPETGAVTLAVAMIDKVFSTIFDR